MGIEPITSGLTYHYSFHYQNICLWSGLYLHLLEMAAVKSLHVPFQASLGIGMSKRSPNLTAFTIDIAIYVLLFTEALCSAS